MNASKLINTLLVLVMTFVSTSCVAQSKLFKDASSIEGVTTIYVSPLMCRMGMTAINAEGDLGPVKDGIKKLSCLEIVNCENAASIPAVQKICRPVIDKLHMEVLTEVNENKEHVTIYARVDSAVNTPTTLNEILIECIEPSEYTMVYIKGEFDVARIMQNCAD